MKHTYVSALSTYWRGCEWIFTKSDDFNTLTWLSHDTPKPTLEELEARMIELDLLEAKRLLRIKRNEMLRESDVKSLPDYPHKNEEDRISWLIYRQQLRDVTKTTMPSLTPMYELDEASIEWPTLPQ
jgi:hypothetical protein